MRWGTTVALLATAPCLPLRAGAQELPPPPPYPDVPQVTEPLSDALDTGAETITPPADAVLSELGIVGHLAGPALRPECSALGSLVVASVLTAGYTPVAIPLDSYLTPMLAFCLSTYNIGTLDYTLRDVDEAVGPTVTTVVDTAIAPAVDALAPVHEQAAPACGYSPLVSSPLAQVPPPLNRVPLIDVACGAP